MIKRARLKSAGLLLAIAGLILTPALVLPACECETSGIDPGARSVGEYVQAKTELFSETALEEFQAAVGDTLAPMPLPETLPGDYKIQRVIPRESGIIAKGLKVPEINLVLSSSEIEGYLDPNDFHRVPSGATDTWPVVFGDIGNEAVLLTLFYWQGYPVPSSYYYDCFMPEPEESYLTRYVPETSSAVAGSETTEKIGDNEVYLMNYGGTPRAEWRLPDWEAPQFVIRAMPGRAVTPETFRDIIAAFELPDEKRLLPLSPGDYAFEVVFPDPVLEEYIRTRLPSIAGPLRPDDVPEIEVIDARGKNIVSLDGLEHCTGLKTLKLEDNHVSDLPPLAGLTGLTELDLTGNDISDLRPLAGLTNLKVLKLGHNRIEDIEPLASLTGLEYLDLGWNEIEDIGPLSRLTALEHLDLGVNRIPDIMALASLENLTYLYLSHNRIANIFPLASLTKLETLVMGDNMIEDISPLSNLKSLRILSLYDNKIYDVAPLAGMEGLEGLDLRINEISDLSPLAGATLPELRRFHLDCNFIDDAAPLAEADLPKLESLILRWNRLSGAEIEKVKETVIARLLPPQLEHPEPESGETHTPIPVEDMPIPIVWAEEEAPDDVVSAPGMGPTYRANIVAVGKDGTRIENPWPSVEGSSTSLSSGSDVARISFRERIETAAGETRNNIIGATIRGEDFNLGSVNSLSLYADDVPDGIKLTVGSEWSGPFSRASVLVIEIAPDMAPGIYPLEIGLMINSEDYGRITCIVEVVTDTFDYDNAFEFRAKKITLEEASDILDVTVPVPTYLPKGFGIQDTYIDASNSAVMFLIFDRPPEQREMEPPDELKDYPIYYVDPFPNQMYTLYVCFGENIRIIEESSDNSLKINGNFAKALLDEHWQQDTVLWNMKIYSEGSELAEQVVFLQLTALQKSKDKETLIKIAESIKQP